MKFKMSPCVSIISVYYPLTDSMRTTLTKAPAFGIAVILPMREAPAVCGQTNFQKGIILPTTTPLSTGSKKSVKIEFSVLQTTSTALMERISLRSGAHPSAMSITLLPNCRHLTRKKSSTPSTIQPINTMPLPLY